MSRARLTERLLLRLRTTTKRGKRQACAVPQGREEAIGESQSGVPRGYVPLVAGRSPRRGGSEPRWNRGERWKGEVSSPSKEVREWR